MVVPREALNELMPETALPFVAEVVVELVVLVVVRVPLPHFPVPVELPVEPPPLLSSLRDFIAATASSAFVYVTYAELGLITILIILPYLENSFL